MDFSNISNAFTQVAYAVTGKTEKQEEGLKKGYHIGSVENSSDKVITKELVGATYNSKAEAIEVARNHKGSELVYKSNIDDKWHIESLKKVDKKGVEADIESRRDSIHGGTEIKTDTYNFSKKAPIETHYSFVDDDGKSLKEVPAKDAQFYPDVDFSSSNYFYDVVGDLTKLANKKNPEANIKDVSTLKEKYAKTYNMKPEQFEKAQKIASKLSNNPDLLEKFNLIRFPTIRDSELLTPSEKQSGKQDFNRMKFLLELSGDKVDNYVHQDRRYFQNEKPY